MEIKLDRSSVRRFTQDITTAIIGTAAREVIPRINDLNVALSIHLASDITESQEWKELKSSKLIAEFGFAPWEVDELDEIKKYLIPGTNDITYLETNASPIGSPRSILHWLDFNKLLWNPFAMHELSRRGSRQARKSGSTIGGFSRGQEVSWLYWFEYGVTIPGFDVEYPLTNPKAQFFSRSKLGLMIPEEGGFWSFQGRGLFAKTEQSFVARYGENFTKQALRMTKIGFKKRFRGRARRA